MKIKTSRFVKSEENASKHINILTHYDDDTLIDKSGKLIKIIQLSGLEYMTKNYQILDAYKIRRNNLFKNFSSEFAFYFWEVRKKSVQCPSGNFPGGFAKDLNYKYQKKIKQSDMFHTELYLAIITKQPEGILNQITSLLSCFNQILDKQEKKYYILRRYKELCDATQKIISVFSDYNCRILSVYEKNSFQYSEPLEFLSQLINFDSFPVPLDIQDVAMILPRKRLFFNHQSGTIEMRSADGRKKFAAMLSIKAYAPLTYQGMLNELNQLRCEYILTQSFRLYDRQLTKIRLRNQQNEMLQSNEESVTQTEQIDDAFDDAASGEVGYGKHHFTIACYADTEEDLSKSIAAIISIFSNVDIVCVREDIASELAFWAQFPGNFGYIARAADISTKNMAALASFHNQPLGKFKNNYWGDAVTVFETLSGSPYYFNFHYKDVGNFLVFGSMGSGKTVLVGFLIAQSMKFGGKRIIFDKDRGLEIFVRAMGGIYEQIKPGIATGFNPCLLDDNTENRYFLSLLFQKILSIDGNRLSESEIKIIENCIDGLYQLEISSRQFKHIASFFGVKKPGSLRARFDQWHSEGVYAWLFDNENDTLNLSKDIIGFDLGYILTDEICKTPALMYLTYRVEQAIVDERGLIFFDEGWNALADDYFKEMINDLSRTPRKKNNIFGLATQVVNDTANLSISKSINESAFCKIFFPNPSADKKVYVEDLGLSECEYNLVKALPDDQHYFLLNYGRGSNKQSVVVRANLSGMENEIAIISAREETLLLLDQIRSEVGDDPTLWMPIFQTRKKESHL